VKTGVASLVARKPLKLICILSMPFSVLEMCIAYLFYYPRQLAFEKYGWSCGWDIGYYACDADWEMTELESVDSLGRTFGVGSDVCPSTTSKAPVTDGDELATAPSPSPVADSGVILTVNSLLFTTAFLFWLSISV
jgi:hypothetical protein